MGESMQRLQFWLKRGLAIVLFVGLLVGASATAFYALAAGISAMSGFAGRVVVEAPSTFIQPGQSVGSANSPSAVQTFNPSASTTGAKTTNPSNSGDVGSNGQPALPIQSSVGEAIDGGGFALGIQVQRVFGSVLGGVLNTLFLNQPMTSNNNGGSSGQSN